MKTNSVCKGNKDDAFRMPQQHPEVSTDSFQPILYALALLLSLFGLEMKINWHSCLFRL